MPFDTSATKNYQTATDSPIQRLRKCHKSRLASRHHTITMQLTELHHISHAPHFPAFHRLGPEPVRAAIAATMRDPLHPPPWQTPTSSHRSPNPVGHPRGSHTKDAWPQATTRYNRAIRTLFDRVRCGGGNWEDRAREIDTSIASASAVYVAPEQFDSVIPADQVRIKSKDRVNDVHGIGFSAIGWSETTSVGIPRSEFTPPNGKGLNLTAILDFSTSPPQWKFFQRWVTETCSINRQPQRMTADWTAPIDYFWYKCDLDNIRLQNLFIPERFTKETGMYFLRPYDPKKSLSS